MAQTVLGRMKSRARREGEILQAQRAVQQAILIRFPAAAPTLAERVGQIRSVKALEDLLARVIMAGSAEEAERLLRAGT